MYVTKHYEHYQYAPQFKHNHIYKLKIIFFFVARCILIYVEFTRQQMHFY